MNRLSPTPLTRALSILVKTWLACFALLVFSSTSAQNRIDPDQFGQWTMSYYLSPQPAQIANALVLVSEKGYFENKNVQGPLTGFFTAVFRDNPEKIADWITPYIGIPDCHILYSALWMANSPRSYAALELMAQGASPAAAKRLRRLAATRPPTIASMAINSGSALDYMWGYFFATGQAEPVQRVINQMKLANTEGNTTAFLIGSAAQWAVESNARQHKAVRRIARASVKTADPQTRALLKKILARVDMQTATK